MSDCSDGADVAFMLDNADISPLKFYLEKEFIKKIMKKIVKRSAQFNAAIVLYNHQATVQLNFTKKFEMDQFFHATDNLESLDPSLSLSRVDRAIQVTSDLVFGAHGGSRQNTPKIAVLLTRSSFPSTLNPFLLKNASESLKQKSVRLLIVGIGVDVCKQELYDITEDKSDLIMVKGFSSLPEFEDVLVDKICSAVGE